MYVTMYVCMPTSCRLASYRHNELGRVARELHFMQCERSHCFARQQNSICHFSSVHELKRLVTLVNL